MIKRLALLSIAIFISAGVFAQLKLKSTYEEKRHGVITSAISYDGKRIATAGDNNDIILWNAHTGNIYRKLTNLDKWTKSLVFSRDGKILVSGGKDSKVYVWDVERGGTLNTFIGHSGDVNAVCINADNSLIASGDANKSIKIWDLKSGKLLRTLSEHRKDITSLDFSPQGTSLASASADGTVIIWNTSKWTILSKIKAHRGWVRCVVFSSDGSLLASSGDDNDVKIYSSNGVLKSTLKGHRNWVQNISFSADGKYLVSGSHDKTFIVWEVESGNQVFQSPTMGEIVYSVNFNPDGKTLVATNLLKREFSVYDATSLNIKGRATVLKSSDIVPPSLAQESVGEVDATLENPELEIRSITFSDANRNNILDAGEKSFIDIVISNSGKGPAQDVKLIIVEQNNLRGLDFNPLYSIGSIQPNAEERIRIPINAADYMQSGEANFKVTVTDARSFNPKLIQLAVQTKKLEVPLVVLHEYVFTPVNADVIVRGSKFKLSMVVQNQGDAPARLVRVKFDIPENAFIVSDTEFTIPELAPLEYKQLEIELMTNNRYIRHDVPVEVFITESSGNYGDRKIASARFNEGAQGNTSSSLLALTPERQALRSDTHQVETKKVSDIDEDVPIVGKPDPNRYALIIGNEDYSSHQRGLKTEADVEFAVQDAKAFKVYAQNVLRVPEDNIILRTNATAMEMHRALSQINTIAKINEGKAEIFVMYAGHGFPDEKTQEPYLIPVDVSGADLQFAIKLCDFYAKLIEYPTRRVTVFLDACFSGGGREQGLIAARGVKVRPKENTLSGNLVVFAATSGDQSALPWKEKNHGMFTYHLLQKLKETKGQITYGELADYLRTNVGTRSVIVNQKEQNPQTNVSNDVVDKWVGWSFK